jgi:PadR family transcriptional regulator PadR
MLEELTAAKIMVVEGTLYPLLTRLKNAGLVEYKWVESTSGPPRKYYTLTQAGSEFLSSLQLTWTELVTSTSQIMNNNGNGTKPVNNDAINMHTSTGIQLHSDSKDD